MLIMIFEGYRGARDNKKDTNRIYVTFIVGTILLLSICGKHTCIIGSCRDAHKIRIRKTRPIRSEKNPKRKRPIRIRSGPQA